MNSSLLIRQIRRLPGPWWPNNKRQVIFIASQVRSGSTWLSFVIGNHPNSAHLGEYHRPFEHPGHISCKLCQAKGLADCEVLNGLGSIPISNAYGFALERYHQKGITTIVDCSKQLSWLKKIIDKGGGAQGEDLPIKVIHLVREPRGWLASQQRRNPGLNIQAELKEWKDHFFQTRLFLKQKKINFISTTYDQLCLTPKKAFKRLARFTGLPFNIKQLEYWNREHHGLGGNGAAMNNLHNTPFAKQRTADDKFYKGNLHKNFYDLRWISSTDANELENLKQDSIANKILHQSGTSFSWIDHEISQYLKHY